MNDHAYLHALAGGCMIGLASLIGTAWSGRVPGISGLFGRLLLPTTQDKAWRFLFLVGLIAGAALTFTFSDSAAIYRPLRPLVVTAVAGALVGFGTRLGGGCTSGHGVCGVGMGAIDSIVATLIFVGVAMITVSIYGHVIQ